MPPAEGRLAAGTGREAKPFLDVLEPFDFGNSVGPEFLDPVFFLAVIEGPVFAELAAGGCVDQRARVVGAHLEEDAVLELLHALAIERPVHVVHAVAPDDGVDAHRRTVAEHVARRASTAAAGLSSS